MRVRLWYLEVVVAALVAGAAVSSVFALSSIMNLITAYRLPEREYSYVGDDYPAYYPLSKKRKVATAMDESVHYGIFEQEAAEQWASNQVKGRGVMRWALSGNYDEYAQGHVQHCLNYLRQQILCSPNLTLEPANILTRDHDVERAGAIHVCNDWRILYEELGVNWEEWKEFVEGHESEIFDDRPSRMHSN
ncbi:hypothetical protein NP233_g9946 [Leucocoprinus birnbaumii]|uniref:Uncharacterized protein n=1 Tax=Leucocoprinus birnbaumii TaxID=56174 RepID=A0AAD5VK80_9AGAR|nr:hypothetical protein NP233_g9946 [Leucocoprinus birnbaumii]